MSNTSAIDPNIHWYKDAIIYELHIKAFFDSNGDGIGDFKGLLQKLDYLEDLGVTAIWLLPFYPSPLRDDGYDIQDYYNINPSYGTIKTFKKFIKEAHKRGLKVITELVINHTSDQHEWFQRARKAEPGSNYRDYYVWTEDPSQYKDARIIFTDTEPSNWTWDPVAKAYFWHRFFSHQPDLNFDNPNVQEEVFKVMDHWCKMGVDGFRLDAVPYLFERDGTNCENLPETHDFLKKLRAYVDEKYEGKMLLAEANMWPEDSAAYFGEGDECHMNYHFPIMPRMFMAVKMEDRYPIIDIIDQTPDIPETCQWAIFLRNHDELTLEMVTDEERDYMYKVYTKDPQAKINVGIRHRLAPLLENNRNKIELMNVLLFSLPGTPVLYYGDEIGMGDNFYLGDRDGVRTPMQWNSDRNAGFSEANPHKLYLPTIIDPEYKYEAVNVEAQQMNGSSLLWWMKRIIAMRKRYKAFGRGDIQFLSPANAKVIAYTRSYEDENLLILANLSRFSQAVELDLQEFKDYIPVEVFSHNKFPRITDNPYLFTLSPHGYYWFTLEREKGHEEEKVTPSLKAKSWTELLNKRNKKKIETILPEYLTSRAWFGGRNRVIQSVSVTNVKDLSIKDLNSSLIVAEVTYNEGLPESYQLPLAFVSNEREDLVREIPSKGILADAQLGEETGLLIDAVYAEPYRSKLFENIKKGKKVNGKDESLEFYKGKSKISANAETQSSKVYESEISHTSIFYDNRYYLKLYRRLDSTINPDLEITQYLSEVVKFKNSPTFVGGISYHTAANNRVILGMMEDLTSSNETGWQYAQDALHRYFEQVETRDKEIKLPKIIEDITSTLRYDDIPDETKGLMGSFFPERMKILGQRSAELHKALASRPDVKDFDNEEFSLHYQRSLFSSLQGLTRSAFDNLKKNIKTLPEEVQAEAKEILSKRAEVLKCFKRVFAHKIDTLKIRTHGDYHLNQVLFTGNDFTIINYEGEPARPFSERRLRRSPLRDVAGMVRSFHYAAYSHILAQEYDKRKEKDLEDWAEVWHHYITRLFLQGYNENIGSENLVPENDEDYNTLLDTFLLEKAVYELNYELNHRKEWVLIPLRGIARIIDRCQQSS